MEALLLRGIHPRQQRPKAMIRMNESHVIELTKTEVVVVVADVRGSVANSLATNESREV
jgi:hypothetical protein